MVRRVALGIGIALIANACSAAPPTRKKPPAFVDDGDDMPRPPRQRVPKKERRPIDLAADGSFRALFPGNPIMVTAHGIRRDALPPDQRAHPVKQTDRERNELQFEAAGIYTDDEQVRHLALVPTQRVPDDDVDDDVTPTTRDVLWFDLTGANARPPWNAWRARSSGASVLTYESRGEIIALRYIPEFQRLQPLALDPRLPMALVERGSTDDMSRPIWDEVIGLHDSSLVHLLLLDVRSAAVTITGVMIVLRRVPDLDVRCTPDRLVSIGCASEQTIYEWTGHTFAEGAPVPTLVKLVDAPAKR